MSRTKAVRILGRGVWVLDNSHDIVVARMVEEAERLGSIDDETLQSWRVWASVRDLGFQHDGPMSPALAEVLRGTRAAIQGHGNVHRDELAAWHLLDDIAVSSGFLRYDVLPVDALINVLDGFADLFDETLRPDPPSAWWLLGVPGGRKTIGMRMSSPGS